MPKSRKTFNLVIPFIARVNNGKTMGYNLSELLGEATVENFKGAPWRLLSINGEVSVRDSSRASGIISAVAQVRLNTAGAANVEAVASKRLIVGIGARKFNLTVPKPNPWKEDEDRTQDLINLDNIDVGDGLTSVLIYYVQAKFEFGPLPFASTVSLRSFSEDGSGGSRRKAAKRLDDVLSPSSGNTSPFESLDGGGGS